MELLVERTFAIFIAISGPILTIFDLPGNTLLLLTSLMFAFFDEVLYFNGRLLSAMVLIYALGEFWEFCVGLFGIKRSKVSWFEVIFIALDALFCNGRQAGSRYCFSCSALEAGGVFLNI